jgi:hypothetical protein
MQRQQRHGGGTAAPSVPGYCVRPWISASPNASSYASRSLAPAKRPCIAEADPLADVGCFPLPARQGLVAERETKIRMGAGRHRRCDPGGELALDAGRRHHPLCRATQIRPKYAHLLKWSLRRAKISVMPGFRRHIYRRNTGVGRPLRDGCQRSHPGRLPKVGMVRGSRLRRGRDRYR